MPVGVHPTERVPLPELVFGQLMTGSNFNDAEERLGGGQNGLGIKLVNVFSTRFAVRACDARTGDTYENEWFDRMQRCNAGKLTLGKPNTHKRGFVQVRGSAPLEPRWGCAPNPPPLLADE